MERENQSGIVAEEVFRRIESSLVTGLPLPATLAGDSLEIDPLSARRRGDFHFGSLPEPADLSAQSPIENLDQLT